MKVCAFENDKQCNALKTKKCEGCHFFKTKEELINGRKKAAERISKLSPKTQTQILNKYYDLRRTQTE